MYLNILNIPKSKQQKLEFFFISLLTIIKSRNQYLKLSANENISEIQTLPNPNYMYTLKTTNTIKYIRYG